MADIFIIYASENRQVAKLLYAELSLKWDVVYDYFSVDDFAIYIEEQISKAKCVLPVFSSESQNKNYFTDELRLAKKYEKPLVAIKIDDSDNPFGFGQISFCEFKEWGGHRQHSGFKQLQHKISSIIKPTKPLIRPTSIPNSKLHFPVLFQSVSSFETQLRPDEAVEVLKLFKVPVILVSAYDLVDHDGKKKARKLKKQLQAYKDGGGSILIDSGNYEKSRLVNKAWNRGTFKNAISDVSFDWLFCFDVEKPDKDPIEAINQIVKRVRQDQKLTDAPVLPIVHTQLGSKGEYDRQNLPLIIRGVAEALEPLMVAVPERELGDGIVARVKMVQRIRSELDKLSFYQPIHLLGTGNPWTIPLFVAAGADSFDGLEWCRMVVDREEGRLNHFQHFDFFTYQAAGADSNVAREALQNDNVNFYAKVVFHNLDYYTDFMSNLRSELNDGNIRAFVTERLPKDIISQMKEQIPGLFK
jgi:hypothetical protein